MWCGCMRLFRAASQCMCVSMKRGQGRCVHQSDEGGDVIIPLLELHKSAEKHDIIS
jgi:hypothetical protein